MSSFLNDTDIALHDHIHAEMMQCDPIALFDNPRMEVFKFLRGLRIQGTVADVGCGSGYFGIAAAKRFPEINRVDCIEASRMAVEQVIQRNIEFYDLTSRVNAVYGSYDQLEENFYDVVFAMGSLHHSANLRDTIASIERSLKPGGLLICQEPAMPDTTTHDEYQQKYNMVETRYGMRIRNGDRYDRFFRECEYKYNLIINGLDIFMWQDFKYPRTRLKLKGIFNNLRRYGLMATLDKIRTKIFSNDLPNSNYGHAKSNYELKALVSNVVPKIFIAQKGNCGTVFHRD